MIAPVDTSRASDGGTHAPLVVRSPSVRAGGLMLFAVFAGTLAGGFSTVAVLVCYPVLALVLLYGARGVLVMARCTESGIKVRNQWRTVKLPWAEIAGIEAVPRGADRRAARAAGVVVRRDGRRIPLEATYLPQDAAVPVPSGPDRGGPKVEAIRTRWAAATSA